MHTDKNRKFVFLCMKTIQTFLQGKKEFFIVD